MALNFSHRPIFPVNLAEDNLVSPMRIANGCLVEGSPERNSIRQWPSNREVEDLDNNSMDWEHVLPADPFGMDISCTFEAITEFLEYLEDYRGYGRADVSGVKGDSSMFAGWNFFINKAAIDIHHPIPGNAKVGDNTLTESESVEVDDAYGGVGSKIATENVELADSNGGVKFLAESVEFDDDNDGGVIRQSVESNDGDSGVGFWCTMKSVESYDGNGGVDLIGIHQEITTGEVDADPDNGLPHPALFFALGYLGIRDLLSVERVCKSLRSTVQNDPLLWRSIHIERPLTERITDDILLHLTSRAQGNLQCLSLIGSQRITDDGLRRVLESNKRLTKLSVPECTRLSIDGIVSSLRAFQKVAITGIKHIRIAGLLGVSQQHFEEIVSFLGDYDYIQTNYHKTPFYYRGGLSHEDGRPIDIEMCPNCQNFRLVFDCPADSCQGDSHSTPSCRACLLCIPRCACCGTCVSDGEYEETFFLQPLCSYCGKVCQEKPGGKHIPPKQAACEGEGSSFDG